MKLSNGLKGKVFDIWYQIHPEPTLVDGEPWYSGTVCPAILDWIYRLEDTRKYIHVYRSKIGYAVDIHEEIYLMLKLKFK